MALKHESDSGFMFFVQVCGIAFFQLFLYFQSGSIFISSSFLKYIQFKYSA